MAGLRLKASARLKKANDFIKVNIKDGIGKQLHRVIPVIPGTVYSIPADQGRDAVREVGKDTVDPGAEKRAGQPLETVRVRR